MSAVKDAGVVRRCEERREICRLAGQYGCMRARKCSVIVWDKEDGPQRGRREEKLGFAHWGGEAVAEEEAV